jgi:hypothetical protein
MILALVAAGLGLMEVAVFRRILRWNGSRISKLLRRKGR